MVLRWRGRLNWKDIAERVIANIIGGVAAGLAFYTVGVVLG